MSWASLFQSIRSIFNSGSINNPYENNSGFDPLYIDSYIEDSPVDWQAYCAAGLPWFAADFKATEGLQYSYQNWLTDQISAASKAAGSRLGVNFFYGSYHYLHAAQDGSAQADFHIKIAKAAGGFGKGWWFPMVDVESAGNSGVSAQQVIDCTSAYATRVHQVTGMKVRLYGESLMADLGITSQMECDYLEPARYDFELPSSVITNIGWTEDKLFGWQYRGDNYTATLKNSAGQPYPNQGPGTSLIDISVLTFPGGLQALSQAL